MSIASRKMFTIYVSVYNTQSPFTAQICGGNCGLYTAKYRNIPTTRNIIIIDFYPRYSLLDTKLGAVIIKDESLKLNHCNICPYFKYTGPVINSRLMDA